MYRIIVIAFYLLMISCNNQNKENQKFSKQDSSVVSIAKYNNIDTTKKVPDMENTDLEYFYENDTLFQKIEITSMSDHSISFVLTSINKPKRKSAKIAGVARSKAEVDPEIDEDEEGNAYPAQQYIYEKKCWLSIRIDLIQKDKLRIIEASCEDKHDISCPFESVGILRKRTIDR